MSFELGRLKTPKINLVFFVLIALTVASSFQRSFFRRSSVKAISSSLLPVRAPSGMQLLVSKVYPKAYSEDTYQLAYIVKSLRPDSALLNRKLVEGSEGQIALGVTEKGLPELQTCLMDSDRGAVTNERMVAEVSQSSQADPNLRLSRLLQGILLGRPLTSRPCLLVQLSVKQPVVDGNVMPALIEQRLLEKVWPLLQSLASDRTRELL